MGTYVMRLMYFMVGNLIEGDHKLSVLITVLRSKVIKTLVDLVSPVELGTKLYEKFLKLF